MKKNPSVQPKGDAQIDDFNLLDDEDITMLMGPDNLSDALDQLQTNDR